MKKLFYLLIPILFVLASCSDDDKGETYKTSSVTVQLNYPNDSQYKPVKDVLVKMTNKSDANSYESKTDAYGKAVFNVPAGIYEITSTERRLVNNQRVNFNGLRSGIVVNETWNSENIQTIDLQYSESAHVIIKEMYVGGCPVDNGSGTFNYDKYVILYNNSDKEVNIGKMALATTMPYNATGTNAYYDKNGNLSYASQGWIPAGQAIWYFQNDVILAPGKQIVIALNNAVNNTITYSKSINFDNPDYYCTYDIAVFNHKLTYVSPAASIPTSHYLKAVAYGKGTAWTLSGANPGLFLFTPEGVDAKDFAKDESKNDYYNGSQALVSKKVPVKWITDGVEVFSINMEGNQKRLTPNVDAGYVFFEYKMGYSVYRNVDEEATLAIKGNKEKLVYNYKFGTETLPKGTTDPSGIDAEASIKNGARIVYEDSNNSSNDFHQRIQASLRN